MSDLIFVDKFGSRFAIEPYSRRFEIHGKNRYFKIGEDYYRIVIATEDDFIHVLSCLHEQDGHLRIPVSEEEAKGSIYVVSVNADDAKKISEWFALSGGVDIYSSVDLSIRRNDSIVKAGEKYSHWAYRLSCEVRTKKNVQVSIYEPVKRIKAVVRLKASRFAYVLSDACQRKDAALSKYEGSSYEFDYESNEVVILRPAVKKSLVEWEAENA